MAPNELVSTCLLDSPGWHGVLVAYQAGQQTQQLQDISPPYPHRHIVNYGLKNDWSLSGVFVMLDWL